jgi:formate C-acetyltransferase
VTYRERIALLREKKIRHTLEKKAQKGYMDGDDYGTIPLPEGYLFTPMPTGDKPFFYGAMGNALNFAALLEAHPVYVDELEILCGRWADMLPNYRGGSFEKLYPYDDLKPEQVKYGIGPGIGADAHFACDYRIGLKLGFGGLLNKIETCRSLSPGRTEFYLAEEITLKAIIRFIDRHIEEVRRRLAGETRPDIIKSLREMLEANLAVRLSPPETFLQACQWVSWFSVVSRIYDRDGAGCNLDVLLYPYYRRDVDKGILDEEKATFILANVLLIETHYHQLSGADEEGNDLTNPLSFLVLDAAHWLNASANLTVRMHDKIDPAFLRRAVTYLFTDRNGWPRFSGARGLLQYERNPGVTHADAARRIAVGCNWMAVPGVEYPLNDCVKINVARIFRLSFDEMMESCYEPSLEKLLNLLKRHLIKAVEVTAKGILLHLNKQQYVMPELVMNLMMENTLETGQDISMCARLKTMGVDGVGLGTVADSLAALEQRVVLEKRVTFKEVYDGLKSDFEGTQGERLRLMLKSSGRYCGGGTLGDKWAGVISRLFADTVVSQPMPEGVSLVPGWFSWSSTIYFGKMVGVTPDGRRAGTPVTHGANPNPGFRRDGAVTAMATGIARIQTGYGNPCPLQLEFDPGLSIQEGGIELTEQVLKTHVRQGGTLININVLDKEKLMKAHENPMLYPDLVVRVTGFTAYFATLSPEFRQLVVDRFISAQEG